jgi:hypothetical protein
VAAALTSGYDRDMAAEEGKAEKYARFRQAMRQFVLE